MSRMEYGTLPRDDESDEWGGLSDRSEEYQAWEEV
jgi:hypothetical protein